MNKNKLSRFLGIQKMYENGKIGTFSPQGYENDQRDEINSLKDTCFFMSL